MTDAPIITRWVTLVRRLDGGDPISLEQKSTGGKDVVERRVTMQCLALLGDPERFEVIGSLPIASNAKEDEVIQAVELIAGEWREAQSQEEE